MRTRFALFDSLRGVSVTAVMAFHVALFTGRLGNGAGGRVVEVLGGEAVVLFFVISGFLLYRPFVFARAGGLPRPDTRSYLKRRAFRILPAYWVVLTALAIFPGVVGVFSGDWWRYYGFLQLYSPDTVDKGLPVAWTLCVEVTFYLLLPLWAIVLRRLPSRDGERWVRTELLVLGLVAAGGIAIELLAARQLVSRTLANTIVGQIPWLALGMAFAVASVAVARREQAGHGPPAWVGQIVARSGLLWTAALLAVCAMAAIGPGGGALGLLAAVTSVQPLGHAVGHVVLTLVVAFCLVAPAVFGEDAGGMPRRFLAFAPIAWLGTVSYSMYLWHLTVSALITLPSDPAHFSAGGLDAVDHIHTATTVIIFVLTLAATAALSAVTYYGVERPFMRRSHRPRGAP